MSILLRPLFSCYSVSPLAYVIISDCTNLKLWNRYGRYFPSTKLQILIWTTKKLNDQIGWCIFSLVKIIHKHTNIDKWTVSFTSKIQMPSLSYKDISPSCCSCHHTLTATGYRCFQTDIFLYFFILLDQIKD